MKFVILHGTGATHESNWFPWLKAELEIDGHEVWAPDLPGAKTPDAHAWTTYLLESGYDFNDSVIIGHSAGAVETQALLQALPEGIRLKAVIMVGIFRGDLKWDTLKGMNIHFDYPVIKQRSESFYIVHSDNDPYCPLDGAQWIADQLGAEFILLNDMGHFSHGLDPRFDQFPELLTLIQDKVT